MEYINTYVTPLVIEYVDIHNQKILDNSYFTSVHFQNILQGCHQLLQQNVEFYEKMKGKGSLILKKINTNQGLISKN